jgi:hypothetical protein
MTPERVRPNFDEATTVEFATSEGDEIQLMAPGDPYSTSSANKHMGPCRCSRSTMFTPHVPNS